MTEPTDEKSVAKLKQEMTGLALRVRDGNDKITRAYLQVMDMDDAAFNQGMDKIAEAVERLIVLENRLRFLQDYLLGKSDCLYIMNKQKTRPCFNSQRTPVGNLVDTWCWVCPSGQPYWREEWSDFTRVLQGGQAHVP